MMPIFISKHKRHKLLRYVLHFQHTHSQHGPTVQQVCLYMNCKDCLATLQWLKAGGFVAYREPLCSDVRVTATPLGICYFELRIESNVSFFVKSVLLPIFISILTVIATN